MRAQSTSIDSVFNNLAGSCKAEDLECVTPRQDFFFSATITSNV